MEFLNHQSTRLLYVDGDSLSELRVASTDDNECVSLFVGDGHGHEYVIVIKNYDECIKDNVVYRLQAAVNESFRNDNKIEIHNEDFHIKDGILSFSNVNGTTSFKIDYKLALLFGVISEYARMTPFGVEKSC